MNLKGLAHIMSIEQKPKEKKSKKELDRETIARTKAEIQAIKDVRAEKAKNYIAPSDEDIRAMSAVLRAHNARTASIKKRYYDRQLNRVLNKKR